MSSPEIRPFVPADLEALAVVLKQVHEIDGYPVEGVKEPMAWLQVDNSVAQWTALSDGRPVGHVSISRPTRHDSAPSQFISHNPERENRIRVVGRLFVAPSARRLGVADGLMGQAEAYGKNARSVLVLDVMEKDQAAIRLYERRGWQRLGRIDHWINAEQRVPALAYFWEPSGDGAD